MLGARESFLIEAEQSFWALVLQKVVTKAWTRKLCVMHVNYMR